MNQFELSEITIANDVKKTFTNIFEEVKKDYLSLANPDLEYIRGTLCSRLPRIIQNNNLLLLDTALNYLNADALKVLENSDSWLINAFYEQSETWRETLKKEYQQFLQTDAVLLSFDPRIVYAVGAGIISGSFVGIASKVILSDWMAVALGIISGTLGSLVTYQKTSFITIDKMQKDIERYLQQSSTTTLKLLEKIIDTYKEHFSKFLKEQNAVL